jgi:hypothetical protein
MLKFLVTNCARERIAMLLPCMRPLERMSFCIEDIIIETDQARIAEDEIEILQGLCCPETLHAVRLGSIWVAHIHDGRICDVRLRMLVDALPHFPRHLLELLVTGDSIQNEDALNGFRSEDVSTIIHGRETCRQPSGFDNTGSIGARIACSTHDARVPVRFAPGTRELVAW